MKFAQKAQEFVQYWKENDMPRNKELFDKQNDYNRTKYDRFSLMLPKGEKEQLQAVALSRGMSLNALIISAIKEYVK